MVSVPPMVTLVRLSSLAWAVPRPRREVSFRIGMTMCLRQRLRHVKTARWSLIPGCGWTLAVRQVGNGHRVVEKHCAGLGPCRSGPFVDQRRFAGHRPQPRAQKHLKRLQRATPAPWLFTHVIFELKPALSRSTGHSPGQQCPHLAREFGLCGGAV